jgi:hypothetical protein
MLEISKLFFFKEKTFVIKNEILLEWGKKKKPKKKNTGSD